MGQPERRKKKRKAAEAVKIIFHAVMIILFLALVLLTAYQTVQEAKKAREQVYESVSMREEATAKAYVWLSQVDDMPFSYEDIRQMMGELDLTVILTPAGRKGIYIQAPDEASYEKCRLHANEAFEKAYRETVRHRLNAAGAGTGTIEENAGSPDAQSAGEAADAPAVTISDAMLDDLLFEAYGVSVSEYLHSCDVQLLPEWEELQEIYSGEVVR